MKIYPFFIVHAGCPHRCLFCAQDRSVSQVNVPAPDAVEKQLDEMLPIEGNGEIAFYGGSFAQLPQSLQDSYLAAAAGYLAAGRAAGVRVSTRPDSLDDATVQRLKASGVTTIEIGCQSFDDSVLDAAERGHDAACNRAAVQLCQEAGLQVGIQLMPGLLGGDAHEAVSSLREALVLAPSFLRIYPTVVIAGTGLAEKWRAGGYRPWSLDEAVEVCADMLQLCREKSVPVIRIGLHNDPQLLQNLLAGPFHPAFGQLVRSRLWRRALAALGVNSARVGINPVDISDVTGHRGENRLWLAANLPGVRVAADSNVRRGRLLVAGRELALNEVNAKEIYHG